MKKKIRIATRFSSLALVQSQLVQKSLEKLLRKKGLDCSLELVPVKTLGDRNKDISLFETFNKTSDRSDKDSLTGFFVREIEWTLLEGRADLAVHSLKDLPISDTEGLIIRSFGWREDARDLFISERFASLKEAEESKHARIGTSSLRRKALLLHYYPRLVWTPLRGNVESRVNRILKETSKEKSKERLEKRLEEKKDHLQEENLDGIILACAGIKRLGLEQKNWETLPLLEWLPAAGQGILALQTQKNNLFIQELMMELCDPKTEEEMRAERLVLQHLQGGCQSPIGVYAQYKKQGILKLTVFVGSSDGQNFLKEEIQGDNLETLAREISQTLIEKGAGEILRLERT